MNFIKNIFKALVTVALVATAATAFAGSVNENAGNFPTFLTTDKSLSNSSWGSSTTISPGELLSFRLHYYLEEGDSTPSMRFSMDDLNNKVYNEGNQNVSGRVSATGLSSSSGSVNVNFTERVKLSLYNVSWQVVPCSSVGCQESLPDSPNKVLTSSGFNIGEVDGTDSHYAGNLVISFRVDAEGGNNNEVDGQCGSAHRTERTSKPTSNLCSYGTASSVSTGSSKYTWTCYGDNGGSNDACYADIKHNNNNDDIEVSTNSASSVDEDSAVIGGEVEEGDNLVGWLVLSDDRDDVTCQYRSTNFYYNLDEGDEFEEKIRNLDEDETYYFRACVTDGDDVESGSIKSFKTDDDDDNNNSDDIEVTTDSATNIEDTSARLRGELDEGDDAEVWFAISSEFGSSPSCSNNSQRKDVNGDYDSGDNFFTTVSGLDDDTRYFFRACAEDDNGDDSGEIRSFETDGNGGDDGQVSTLSPSSVNDDSARLNGRLEEGDDLEVWFALSRTDSTPSCSNSSQREEVSGRYDDGDPFSRVVTNLRDNSTYYYRACAEDEDGEDIFGSVRVFVTGNGGNPTGLQSALTGSATGVGTVSARVNGIVSGSGNGECYFNFGTTTNVPLKTADESVNGADTCSAFLSGLSPNTTYFYQTVLERDGVVRKGAIRSFRTSSNLPPVIINNPPADPNPGTTIIRVVDRVDQDEEDLGVTKWVSGEFDDDFVTAIDARRGEVVFYRVLVRNNTDETLEDIVVTDRIPFELELANNNDIDDDSDKQLVWDIDELEPGESKIFITEMSVREDTPVGLEIISFASAVADGFESDSNNVLIEVTGGSIDDDGNNNQGASIFGAGFFPDSLLGWLILIAILIAIAYLISRLLFSRKESHKLNAELAAMEAERMNRLR